MRNTVIAAMAGLALVGCNAETDADDAATVDEAATTEYSATSAEPAEDDNAASDASEAESDEQVAKAETVAAQPVRYGIDGPNLDACAGYGEVSGLSAQGDGFLSVRAAPDVKATELDRLKNGQGISFCDAAKDNEWIGIVYDTSGNLDCGNGDLVDGPKPYDGPCKSGWVSSKYAKLIAG